jgi:hypothetical protein
MSLRGNVIAEHQLTEFSKSRDVNDPPHEAGRSGSIDDFHHDNTTNTGDNNNVEIYPFPVYSPVGFSAHLREQVWG